MFRRLSRSALALTACALVLVPSAQARTIKLNWVDRISADFGYLPMTIAVRQVVITPRAWAVHASITNRSRKAIRIAKPIVSHPPQYTFGLGWAPKCPPPSFSCKLETRDFTYAKPPFPGILRPGQTWKGVYGGPGRPAKGKLIYGTFGYFVPAGARDGFSWLTQNAFKL